MERIGKTIYFDKDVFTDISQNNENIHDLFNEIYRERFLSLESEQRKMAELQKQLKKCEENIAYKLAEKEAYDKKIACYGKWYDDIGSKVITRIGIYKALRVFNEYHNSNYTLREFKDLIKRIEK